MLCATAGTWGASFLFTAIGLDEFEPGLITFLRVGFGCLTLWLLPLRRTRVERADFGRIALLGVVWMAFPLTIFPIAQQWIDSSLTGMLNSAMPVATVVITAVVFAQPTARIQLAGVAVGLVGVGLIGIPEASTAGTTAAGVGLVIVAVCAYGVAVNIAGPLQRQYGALPVLRRATLVATVLTAPYGLIDASRSSFAWDSFTACLALGVFGTGFAFVWATMLTGRVGPVRMSIVTYLIPIVATVLGVIFRDETITAWAVVGTLVVLGGAWLTTLTDSASIARRFAGRAGRR